ncbi:hypothetical protein GCM10007276_25070 [Agaricicola taiwanensis]|uniref:YicC family protein n=1 Tax=Agaricicola taiwanensis TaxID=591372 RepID=A0A8J2YJR9_9RHOB|nr:YicC/YloC family endoribonuclease [Agaricicola taiwanensis]GGE46882.1 hypothetical protein GCM10007276_25070 [Agaricicola taiwanensis]
MSLTSMTGFARSAGMAGRLRWAWELKTVNGRTLDVRIRVPQGFDAIDAAARPLISARLGRGTCYAGLTASREGGTPAVRVNRPALDAVVAALDVLKGQIEATPPSLDGLLAVRGVVEVVEPEEDDAAREAETTALIDGLGVALDDLVAMRRGEGQALARILGDRLDAIADMSARADELPARTPEAVKAKLTEQVRALLETGAALDPDRLHQEAVLLAGKADVREELDRLDAHVATARELISAGGAVGRKLDFLSQELGREANTLCSKSNDIALTRIGLDLKAAIEQFREQVQNVE